MKWQGTAIVMMAAVSIFCILAWVNAEEKITVGRSEEILLLPQGVKLPARIDTGAAICSLDARDLKISGNIAQFKLPEAYGGLELRLPVVRWGHVRSTSIREKRPVVELEIRLGPKLLRVEASLANRSQFKNYPVLIGRNALKQGFLVDVSKWNIAPTDNRRKVQSP
jgi:hypothetical protein